MIDLSRQEAWADVWGACRSGGAIRVGGGAAHEVITVGTWPLGSGREVRWALLRPVDGGEALEVSCEAEVRGGGGEVKISEAFVLLGLTEAASLAEIRARYHRLAGAADGWYRHPDRGGDAGRFTLLVEAYRTAMGRVCPTCGGRRTVVEQVGFSSFTAPCPACVTPGRRRPAKVRGSRR